MKIKFENFTIEDGFTTFISAVCTISIFVQSPDAVLYYGPVPHRKW